jgi:hypothetical protein
MKKQRRNHSAAFKAKVALEAAKEEKMLLELSQQYGWGSCEADFSVKTAALSAGERGLRE